MIFQRHTTYLNYFLPTGENAGLKIFVFTENNIQNFSLQDALDGKYTDNYLLIFYKDKIDYSPQAASILREKVRLRTRIYWLDDFEGQTVGDASYIYLDKNIVKGFNNLGIGIQAPNIQLVHRAVQGSISLDASKTKLMIQPVAGKFYELSAHDLEAGVNEIVIPLTETKAKVGRHTFKNENGLGSLNFKVVRRGVADLLQPVSPYYFNKQNSSNPRSVPVFYFDKSHFNQNVETFVCLKPYKKVSNNPDDFSSYMESVFIGNVKTNFIDEKGRQFYIKKGKMVCRVAAIEFDPSEPESKRFYFIPKDGESLTLFPEVADSVQLFAGFNGTEAFSLQGRSNTVLTFREVDTISLNKAEGRLEKNGDSKTSIIEIGKRGYSLDSERSPIFRNNQLESPYDFVKIGQLDVPVPMPLIPTFSFRDNEDLAELEEVFKKVRLKNITAKLKGKKLIRRNGLHITPQGFLKDGNSYDFIKNAAKSKKGDLKDARGVFKFNITDKGGDLDLSLRKDEVFFVLTPGLFREYKNAVLNARFSVNKSSKEDELFELALTSIFEQALQGEHDNSIIIFKFHKKSVGELLKDTTQWSNDGASLGNQASLRTVVKQINDKKLLEIADPYFTDSILADANWNGVVILNVPIGSADNLPTIFTGLANSQRLNKKDQNQKIPLNTELNFKYAAFPVNKTEITGSSVSIASTSFYGLIDYNPFEDDDDYKLISKYFDNTNWKFVLSKLKVRFANSKITFFESFAFLQVHNLFEDAVTFKEFELSHGSDGRTDTKPNLIRLKGSYQKNSDDTGQFLFEAELNGQIDFSAGAILKAINVGRVGFSYDSGSKDYRFDIDASAVLKDWQLPDLISIKKIDFSNIGLKFKLADGSLPSLDFDLSNLFVLPEIDFDCNGFLSSFPIKFSHFKGYKIKRISGGKIDINYDFFTLPGFKVPDIGDGKLASLFSFIFDFDLGTLGNLAALKALKGQLSFGWSVKGGFALGLKINGPSTSGFHVDLFGALKLDIEKVQICQFEKHFLLILDNARLTVLGVEMPSKESTFSALIFAGKGSKTAWLMSYVSGDKLTLGIGQRVGLPDISSIREVDQAITAIKQIFDPKLDACNSKKLPKVYAPDNNWLVGSDNFVPDSWKDVFDLKFIFNDPVLYGVFLRIAGLFDVDILYKKLSENLGVWSLELALDPSLRNIEMGGASVTLPNIGIDMYTNGDWRGDIGFPRSTSDWSRSCLIQIRPFVGWAGMYVSGLRNASLSLFAQYLHLLPKDPGNPGSKPGDGVNIIQAGFAFRIGIGAYIDKGIFYVGASISVYGIMEGAFAFNKGQGGLKKFFPDHFALRGRVGAIAELIGYVDFKIIKASVHILLRVEFGFLLAIINGNLQPVPVYIEGEVSVRVSVTIACFRIFRKRICIVIHLSFQASVRFPYTLGGGSRKILELKQQTAELVKGPITIELGEIPIIYIPGITKTGEKGNQLVHHFAINFFGCKIEKGKLEFPKTNILKDQIIKPLFDAVLKTGVTHYSQLRDVFLEGPEGQNSTFVVTSYKPVLFAGYSDVTDRAFLKDHYKLTDTEVDSFVALINTADCASNAETCPYRIVPVPIVSTINAVSKDGTAFTTDASGFTIELNGLFTDNAGNTVSVKHPIKRDEAYTEPEIQDIEKFFDDYMTQFVDRSKTKRKSFRGKQDIREDAILQEYFKLIGLLTLESYFNFLSSKDDNRQIPEFNPEIKLSELFADKSEWIFNEHLEELIGQLNYFYNNGLRLLDPKDAPKTKAYYEALSQSSKINAIQSNPVPKDVDIRFTKAGTATFVSLKDDMFFGNGLGEFVVAANKNLGVDFAKLLKEFNSVQKEKPYTLLDVKLPVANSFTNTEAGALKERFFNTPGKISQHFKTERTALTLQVANNKDNTTKAKAIAFTPCINVEAKIKPHQVGDRTSVVELINVYIDDLSLMNKVRNSKLVFKRVHIYLKENKDGKVQLVPLIKAGEEAKTRIVRTNLSPRTHPPVILERALKPFTEDEKRNVASLTEQGDFIRILWESLTTNNGGYYVVESPDSDLFNKMPTTVGDKKVLEYTLVFSFESEEGKPFSAIHNFLKVTDNDDLFDKLDKSSHSLFVDVERVINKKRGKKKIEVLEPVREYHSKLPAHCFAFSIERALPDVAKGHDQYLPLEFEIVGSKEITRNKVLPLMPLERKDEVTGNPIKDKLYYSNITSLKKVTDAANKERYDNVGKTFKLNFGIRDTYGFRAVDLDKNLEYRHVYFDKLIPLNSWPFIECNYWFKEFKSDELVFTLNVLAFKNVQTIPGDDKEKIREALHTAIAQLSDSRVTVTMNYVMTVDLKAPFLEFLDYVLTNLDKPKLKASNYLFKIKATPDFKMVLDPVITVARPNDDNFYVEVDKNVWEKEMIRVVETSIVASNPVEKIVRVSDVRTVPQKDIIRPLNDAISRNEKCPYVLGLSSNPEGEKVLYLVRRDYVTAIKYQASPLPKEHYYGIVPYSNNLFSGSYKPITAGSFEHKFTNIDLDKGLNLILNKVDDLLSPSQIAMLNVVDSSGEMYSQKLVAAKKTLVETELTNKTDNIDKAVPDQAQEKLRKEFRELLLSKLGFFYLYDGMIDLDTQVTTNILQKLNNHRLTVHTGKNPAYNIVSSKLDFRTGQSKWVLLFDQVEQAQDIELEFMPEVTHIETDIIPMTTAIESSTWIQLVEPIKMSAVVSTKQTDMSKKWPSIRRVFPPKPYILEHKAEQLPRSGKLTWTQSNDLGKWRYKLKLQDLYESNDQLDLTIRIRDNSRASIANTQRNFPGFIAYWSLILDKDTFRFTDFIDDLVHQMTLTQAVAADLDRSEKTYNFSLMKSGGVWSKVAPGIPFNIRIAQETGAVSVLLDGEGFDIFQLTNRITAVKPEIKALRNRRARNDRFVYITDVVAPATWAMPQITFDTPIRVEDGLMLQNIFNKMVEINLPYKSTAKFLLNTSDLDNDREGRVPVIPVMQMEFAQKGKPTVSPDKLFDGIYKNGYPAVSVTVYNNEPGENDLPLFNATTIYKRLTLKKQVSRKTRKTKT